MMPARKGTRPMNLHQPALLIAAPLLLALGGCVSFGGEPPESLLTLSPAVTASAGPGAGSAGTERPVIAVLAFDTPAKLDVLRVPVAVSETEIAYLQEAFWVEKPARLLRSLIGETLRARSPALVLDGDDTPALATMTLRGTLTEMGYDAPTSSVVVRFDAMRLDPDGQRMTRRFEARESGVLPEARAVGAALNRASNQVAGEIADWMLAG